MDYRITLTRIDRGTVGSEFYHARINDGRYETGYDYHECLALAIENIVQVCAMEHIREYTITVIDKTGAQS